jgi:enoyl-CoA hydratase/carnithine racemase
MKAQIKISTTDTALCLQICRPDKRNALTPGMYYALTAGISAADADENIRAIILSGIDGCFTSGNDLWNFSNGPSLDYEYPHNTFLDALANAQKPVIAIVDGFALGIGTIMLFHCDFVYASPDTRFSLPFVNLGLSPEGATSYILPHLIGYQRAAEIIMLGEPFLSETAKEIGLVNHVVPAADLMSKALETVEKLSMKSPDSIRQAKALLKRGMAEGVQSARMHELEVFNQRLGSPEAKSAIDGFLNKR